MSYKQKAELSCRKYALLSRKYFLSLFFFIPPHLTFLVKKGQNAPAFDIFSFMKKQILAFVISIVMLLPAAYAADIGDTFGEVQLTSALHFQAQYHEETNTVDTQWDTWGDDAMWYKIIRSQTNPSPTYPEDQAIYAPLAGETSWSDTSPFPGKSFYRLCVITYEKDRYCSNVVIINTQKEKHDEENIICAQVLTPAKNEDTGVCEDFPTPCDVPEGWHVQTDIASCSDENSISLSAERKNDMVHIQWETSGSDTYNSLVLLRAPQQVNIYSPFDAGVEVFPLDKEKKEYFDTTALPRESYTYRICVPQGSKCTLFSNDIFIPAEIVSPETTTEEKTEVSTEGNGSDNTESENMFSDIDADSELGKAILSYALQEVVRGFDDGTFRPEKNVTRAEMAKMAVLANNISAPAVSEQMFCDVPVTEWFAPFITYFVENGYAKGFENTECSLGRIFSPHTPILRSEALKMVLTIAQIDVSAYEDFPIGFSDVPEYHWVVPYAKAAHELGIIDGELLNPDAPATRGEVMLMLSRTQGVR